MDNIAVDNLLLREQVRERFVREIILPQNRPGVKRVLETNVRLENIEAELVDSGVQINGILRITILYVPEDDLSDIETIEKRLSFSRVIETDLPSRIAEIDPALFVQGAEIVIVNPHTLRLTVVVVGRINFIEIDEIELFDDDEIKIIRDRFDVDEVVGERRVTREVDRLVELSANQPGIERIINIQSIIRLINTRVSKNQVEVQAEIRSQILYRTTQGGTRSLNITTPFTERIKIQGARRGMKAFVELDIIDQDYRVVDPKTLKINYEVEIKVLVLDRGQIELPIDIDGEFFPRRDVILVERIVARKQTRVQVQDTIEVPDPGASRVVRVTADLSNQSIEVDADSEGVFISGDVDVNVLYVANQPDQPVFFVGDTLFFDEFIPVSIPRGAERIKVYPEVRIVRAEGEVLDPNRIRVKVLLSIEVLVTAVVEVSVVRGITTERPPAPTEHSSEGQVYIVKSGDTLYKISQRFGVPIAELVAVNDIVNPDQLSVGQRLIIPD
ncbi:DUF3794 and LysM peptidoglycan-binding domain-containing protein [Selenihalanaerobacter shriftii]|uniref:Uncharacterized protein n=1 Tax=Selenihalanaerobacter shriftii TaxID=142842 RepID=A0A1T4N683_9FIRM|nr:SPOCS domain-containing protein [Selenihalanaerobacter shriftii]SJZ74724.1 protein of unknown function [Selenihalanaerobacter shriftii]